LVGALYQDAMLNSTIIGLGNHWNLSSVILTVSVRVLDKNSQFLG
jgi:hypothetical protein